MTGSIETATPVNLEEDSYVKREIEELAYTWINRILALAIGMWTLFAIPDYLFSYDLLIKILPIRLSIVGGLVVVMMMNRTMNKTSRNQFIYSVLAMGGSALATAFICVSYEEHENIHYLAMLLIICAGMGFVPMDFLKSLFLVCLVYVTYLASVLLYGVVNEPKSFLSPQSGGCDTSMTIPPWFSPDWRAVYARLLEQIRKLEAAAVAAGRRIRP